MLTDRDPAPSSDAVPEAPASAGAGRRDLASDGLLARNVALNLAGKGLPLLAALAAIPVLLSGLGPERFGVLALAWVLIGYFSLFDLGIGRSLTQVVSERLGTERAHEVGGIARTGLLATGALGLAGGAVLFGVAPTLVRGVLNVPDAMEAETVAGFRVLALAVPAVVSTAALRGVLEAEQRFGAVNAVLIPMGILLFAAPVAVLPFSTSLVPILGALAAVRALGWAVFLGVTLRELPAASEAGDASGHAAELLRLGGWMTVSNLVSPLMVYLDRFVIGAVLTLAAVTYYATPYEAVTKLVLGPVAVASVFFPAFALTGARDPARAGELFGRSARGIFVLLFPLVLLVVAFAPEGLEAWVGPEVAREGTAVARWLAAGVLFNGLAQVPFALVQGVGRPDVSAKFHLLEAPLYFAALWLCLGAFGITGAAIAWTLRAALDAALLLGASWRLVPETRGAVRWTAVAGAVGCGALALVGSVPGLRGRAALCGLGVAGFAALAWRVLLRDGERAALARMVGGES